MPRYSRPRPPSVSQQLEALLGFAWPMGRPCKYDLSTWNVSDDWPDPVPVGEAEIAVFERWFGDVIDQLLEDGP